MKTYLIDYDPTQNEGVYALSVVKSPAMESKFITLSKEDKKPIQLATISEERRILMGVALIPDKPIYRNDDNGEYNIVFPAETIQAAAYDFIRRGNSNNSTIEHTLDLGSDAVSVVESWIIEDTEQDKSRKYGFNEPVGSWMVAMKIHDDAIWKMAKAGEIEGFSIDGIFNLNEIKMSETKTTSKWEQFKALFAEDKPEPATAAPEAPEEVKLGEVKSADGSVTMEFEGEVLEAGVNVFIVTEEGKTAVPAGSYDLEDNKVLVIEEDGIVASVADKQAEEKEDVEMSDAEFDKLLDAMFGLKEQIEQIKTELNETKLELSKVKDEPASAGIKPKATQLKSDTAAPNKKLSLAERMSNKLNK